MNNVILVDDDNDFIKSFANEAFAKGITIVPKNSLEGLKQLLPAFAHKYAAVVLDIKCLLKDNQAKEDPSFIGTALTYLDSTTSGFPRFILTGDESEFENLKRYYKNEKMFIKKPDDQEKLLAELSYYVLHAEPLRIKRENPDVFALFDRTLLPSNKELTIINIFKRTGELNPANFRGVIGDIREVHEEIYKSINRRNKTVMPARFMSGNGSPSFTGDFYKHMLGNPDPRNNYTPTTPVYQDSTISGLTKLLHNACSEFLHGNSKAGYSISHYTLKSLVNGLMELIIWSKQY